MLEPARQPQSALDDASLSEMVERARLGELDAFNILFSHYNAPICMYLARMIGSDEEGRDLAQDTFLKAWSQLSKMRDPASFPSWLYRIATNVGVDYLRAQKLRRWLPWVPSGRRSEQTEFSQSDPTTRVAETEHVKQALASIAPRYRACLLLQVEGGFSQREIAMLLHLSEKSISIYVQRGCEQFRQAYEHLAPEQSLRQKRSTTK